MGLFRKPDCPYYNFLYITPNSIIATSMNIFPQNILSLCSLWWRCFYD